MNIVSIAPPHLAENIKPSLALRTCTEAHNALAEYLTRGTDFNIDSKRDLQGFRPNEYVETTVLAAIERPGELRAQDDETDLGFLGFAIVTRRLQEYKDMATVQFTFVDDFRPEVFDELLKDVKELCAADGRRTLACEMIFAADGLGYDPRADSLRDAGFELGVVEQMSILSMDNAPEPQLPAGVRVEVFEGYIPPVELVDSFLEIMGIADEDIPQSVPAEKADWTLERLQRAEEINAGDNKKVINAVLVDDEGITAFSYALLYAATPDVAEQEITVSHRRVRRQGHGKAVKAALWQAIADRFPGVDRVITYNATTNTPILAINDKLGMKPVSIDASWTLNF